MGIKWGGFLIRAFVLCDRIGRLWATRQLCLLWILGIVIFLTNDGRLGQVYAGRFIGMLFQPPCAECPPPDDLPLSLTKITFAYFLF